jgi:hypothetical protein
VHRRVVGIHPGKARAQIVLTSTGAHYSGRQLHEFMLCAACEARMKPWEDHAAAAVVQVSGTFPMLERAELKPHLVVAGYPLAQLNQEDRAALTSFILSIVWRSNEAEQCPKVALGPFSDPVRRYLLGENDWPSGVAVRAELMVEDSSMRRTATEVGSRRIDGFRCYTISAFGVIGQVLVGGSVPRELQQFSLQREGYVVLSNGREFGALVAQLQQMAPRKGKLAREA